jgi:hypothetical protein
LIRGAGSSQLWDPQTNGAADVLPFGEPDAAERTAPWSSGASFGVVRLEPEDEDNAYLWVDSISLPGTVPGSFAPPLRASGTLGGALILAVAPGEPPHAVLHELRTTGGPGPGPVVCDVAPEVASFDVATWGDAFLVAVSCSSGLVLAAGNISGETPAEQLSGSYQAQMASNATSIAVAFDGTRGFAAVGSASGTTLFSTSGNPEQGTREDPLVGTTLHSASVAILGERRLAAYQTVTGVVDAPLKLAVCTINDDCGFRDILAEGVPVRGHSPSLANAGNNRLVLAWVQGDRAHYSDLRLGDD